MFKSWFGYTVHNRKKQQNEKKNKVSSSGIDVHIVAYTLATIVAFRLHLK